MQAGDVGSKGEVAVADLDGAVWVRVVEMEIILLDDGFAIYRALNNGWCA